ncbi:MAG TPA: hypothetical protein PKK06_13930 [Phycisphaerae bacterium]|nr:hypothetical protein [Phycisphaerae bacterium]HNU46253.1 hypothetical protein [Phycisphaerae bacterium]
MRSLRKASEKRRTYYGVTNQRVVVLRTGSSPRLQALRLTQCQRVRVRHDSSSGGESVLFGVAPWAFWCLQNTGSWWNLHDQWETLAFHDIPDADEVAQLVEEQRRSLG